MTDGYLFRLLSVILLATSGLTAEVAGAAQSQGIALLPSPGKMEASASVGALVALQPKQKRARSQRPVKAEAEIWMCTGRVMDLVKERSRWARAREELTGIKLYIGTIKKARKENLAELAEMIRQTGLKVAVECGGTLGHPSIMNDTNGEESAKIELRAFDMFYAAGGKIDYLDLDGPIRRLLHPRNRKAKPFTNVEQCADELIDYMQAVRKSHPHIGFWLLTNFPNWGYRDVTSYHARGPKRQDWGDYDEIVRSALKKAKEAGIRFDGVTVDNPYDYLMGLHKSVNLKAPTMVDWVARVRAYEDFTREQGLKFNLIINSEQGGKTSDKAFCEQTLKMFDVYTTADGRPDRYMVQSWYPSPKAIVPDTDPETMTGLVREVSKRAKALETAKEGQNN